MGDPIKLSYSVGATAGYTQCNGAVIPLCGARGEVEAERRGWHAGVGATLGTGVSGNIEVGKRFDINNNWNVDLSANGSHTVGFFRNEYTEEFNSSCNVDIDQNSTRTHRSINHTALETFPSIKEAGISARVNYTTNNGRFTVGTGLSGKYMSNGIPDTRVTLSDNICDNGQVTSGTMSTSLDSGNKSGFVIAPEASAEVKLGKNSHHSIGINASYGFDVPKEKKPNEVTFQTKYDGGSIKQAVTTATQNTIFNVGVTYKYTF